MVRNGFAAQEWKAFTNEQRQECRRAYADQFGKLAWQTVIVSKWRKGKCTVWIRLKPGLPPGKPRGKPLIDIL